MQIRSFFTAAALTFALLGVSTPARAIETLIPCQWFAQGGARISSVVVVFSEGTAWEGEKWVWLTAYNPLYTEQTVEVRAYVDGRSLPLTWRQTIAPKARFAWNMNNELYNRGNHRGRVNFATEVVFLPPDPTLGGGIGVANIAVWDYNYSQIPVYLLGTNLCGYY